MAFKVAILSLLPLLLLFTITASFDQMESLNIQVDIGRRIDINPHEKVFKHWPNPGTTCKVEVVANEPMTQLVGLWEPQIFDCDFKPHTVRYVHFGSPLIEQDTIKLRIYRMTINDTEDLTVQVLVKINRKPYDIGIVRRHLVVREPLSISEAITEEVLDFMPRFMTSDTCHVEFFPYLEPRLPAYGVIVQGAGSNPFPVLDGIKRSCQEFQHLGLRYKHVESASNMDYIPLLIVASRQDFNKGMPWKEWVQLKVVIEKAALNTPPKISNSSTLHMLADQYVLTVITPSVLSAEDAETPWSDLMFNISKPLSSGQGDIVHLDDPAISTSSFRQHDIHNGKIAYRPPYGQLSARTTFVIGLTILDSGWVSSTQVLLNISVRSTYTKAPRVFTHNSVTLVKGQSRIIREQHLKIVDSDNLSQVRVIVTSGPSRGTLLVNGVPSLSFTPHDISQGLVKYNHDNSFGTTDSIFLRVTDSHHDSSVQMTINVLRKDDSPPILLINVGLQVLEAGVVQISPQSLVALDEGTSADRIYFIVLRPPLIGEIQKRLPWQRHGTRTWNFTQDDINQGLIYYVHNGEEIFFDVFDISLKDSEQVPNQSPVHTVMVTVIPVDDSLPRLLPISTLSLTVKETDIAYFTKDIVSYTDEDSKELTYVLQSPPRKVGSIETRSDGRIVSLNGRFVPTKDTDLPGVMTFTQKQIDHFQIVYVPPEEDIGPEMVTVEFTFVVMDEQNNTAPPQNFQIIIIPVNDKAPLLMSSTILCREGEATILTTKDLSLNDVDTDTQDIEIQLIRTPSFGNLVKGNQTMLKGEKFTWGDIEKKLLKYVHNGAEENYDVFILMTWDGKQGVPSNVDVRIELSDDEIITVEEVDSSSLTVLEGGEVVISTEVLSASGLETADHDVVFSLVQFPHEGELLIDEKRGSSFTEADIAQGKVKYRHNGRELGMALATDGMRFEITDSTRRKATYGRSYITIDVPSTFFLNVTILPTDNAPPKITVLGTLDVPEGHSAVLNDYLIVTMDADSAIDDLKIFLKTGPRWGYIENLSPLPGSEQPRSKLAITEWSVRDCNEGYVRYVQREHRSLEPQEDTFTVYVTDGFLNSSEATVAVRIMPLNDEKPKVTVNNFTIRESESKVLDEDILQIEDLDIPKDNLTLSLLHQPTHGTLVQLIGGWSFYSRPREIPFSTMSYQDFDQNLVYKHDGSEHRTDTFSMRVFDGEHSVDFDIHVGIHQVNDQKPTLIRNLGITNAQPNGIAIISDAVLKAEDQDTPDSQIHFQVHTVPSKGELQSRTTTDLHWSLIEIGTTFTQEQVNLNLVRYFHWGLVNGTGKDYFKFTVSDLIHEIGQLLEFEIYVNAESGKEQWRNNDLVVKVERIQVPSRHSVALTSTIISVNDGRNKPDSIQFKIISKPRHGELQLLNQRNQSENMFTMLDILQERVIYKNTQDSFLEDSFHLSVSNGASKKNVTLYIDLLAPKSLLSPIITKADALLVPEDGRVVIDAHILNSSNHNFIYIVTQHPYHGYLLLDGQRLEDRGSTFTQDDINLLKLSYVRYHSRGFTPDSLQFRISNAHRDILTYWVNGNLTQGNTQLSITVFSKKESSFDVSEFLENFGRGKQGFIFAPRNIQNQGRSEDVPITYHILQTPTRGFIEHANTHQALIKDSHFTTNDIQSKNIRYMINTHGTDVTQDSFQVQVREDGQVFHNESINIEWPVVSFTDSQFLVCEDAAQVTITLQRIGKKSDSSYVSIQTISSSARETSDFITSRHRQIQFDPGQSTATKTIQIVTDDLKEPEREIFYIRLHDPINTVIGKNSKAVVTIVDSKRGICSRSNSLPATAVTTEHPFGTITVRTSLNVFETANDTTNRKHIISPTVSLTTVTPNLRNPPHCGRQTEGLLYLNHNNTISICANGSWQQWQTPTSLQTTSPPRSTSAPHSITSIPLGPTPNAREHGGEHFLGPTRKDQELDGRTCDRAWEEYEGACYSWFSRRLTWTAASAFCETRYSAHLSQIIDSNHNRWLFQLTDGAIFWIGLTMDETKDSSWLFTIGDSKFTNWKRGFPRTKGKRGKLHKCAAATPPRAQWVNKACNDDMHSFICSKTF